MSAIQDTHCAHSISEFNGETFEANKLGRLNKKKKLYEGTEYYYYTWFEKFRSFEKKNIIVYYYKIYLFNLSVVLNWFFDII